MKMSKEDVNLRPLSKTVENLAPSGIRKFFDIAAQMQDVISLSVGEPDFVTPWSICEAAYTSMKEGHTHYTSNSGTPELRRAIIKHLEELYDVRYGEDEVLVTVGVSEGLDLAMRTLLDPGDEVIVPEPCFVSYQACVALAGGVPVSVETRAEDKFQVSVAQLEKALSPKSKAILVGFPSNPTGATMPREKMQAVVDFARRNNLYIISDEIYDRMTYVGSHTCVPSLEGARERTILLNGFSKAYAMTGWRLGYACAPASILSAMTKVHQYSIMSAPTTAQYAAIEALKSDADVREMITQYSQRRRFIVEGLNNIGLTCHMPEGAFYAFPSIRSTGLTSEEFAERLLLEEHVAVVPGNAFGAGGEGHIRCSYANGLEKIKIALQRMERFAKKVAAEPKTAAA
jgi:aminotransferase